MPLSQFSPSTPAMRADPARPRTVSAASWVMAIVLEGFAAYAEAMHPVCSDPREYPDRRDAGEATHFRERGDVARPSARHAALPGWSARITSRVAALWSKILRPRGRKPTMMELDILDERMLQDVGLHVHVAVVGDPALDIWIADPGQVTEHGPIDAIRSNGGPCE
jgi:hypothetical protein